MRASEAARGLADSCADTVAMARIRVADCLTKNVVKQVTTFPVNV